MKVSKEIRSLKKRIKKLSDFAADHLMIAFEYEFDNKKWVVLPVYEDAGDGHPKYMSSPFDERYVLQGRGKTIVTAIKKLKKIVRKAEKKRLHFCEW